MDKENVLCILNIYTCTHTHTDTHTMEYYSAIIKNEILSFVTPWMDLEAIMLKKSDGERQILYAFIYMWNLKKTNEQKTRNSLTDTENKLLVAKGERVGRMGKIGKGN